MHLAAFPAAVTLPAHCPVNCLPALRPRLPAAPAYQLQQYYINGRVDDCSAKWTALIECLKKRTKYKEAVSPAALPCCKGLRSPVWLGCSCRAVRLRCAACGRSSEGLLQVGA